MRANWIGIAVLVGGGLCSSVGAFGQVYGYTDDNGVLILSNVPSDTRMRLIAEGNPEQAGRTWRYSGQYDSLILEAATRAGLDSALIKAVIAVESGFNRFAKSHKGAMGLMQLMPDTCKRYGVVNPYDARQNVRAGSKHLRGLLDEFNDLRLSLAAYNAGATPVRRHGNIPPYRETRDYVRKVFAIYRAGSKISITKGGKTYTISPGGRTQMKPAPLESATSESATSRTQPRDLAPGKGRSLAEIAAATRQLARKSFRKGGDGSNPVTAEQPQASKPIEEKNVETTVMETIPAARPSDSPDPLADSQDSSGSEPPEDGPLFYRYKDANGVIYITRKKPTHYEYEILRR
jgi:hypothetical protein